METPPYHLKYYLNYKSGKFTKEDLDNECNDYLGGTDALLLISIIKADGGFSIALMGHDGETDAELRDIDLFKVWSLMAQRLVESTTLSVTHKEIARATFETIRNLILKRIAEEN